MACVLLVVFPFELFYTVFMLDRLDGRELILGDVLEALDLLELVRVEILKGLGGALMHNEGWFEALVRVGVAVL
jgi:hypothetical protein